MGAHEAGGGRKPSVRPSVRPRRRSPCAPGCGRRGSVSCKSRPRAAEERGVRGGSKDKGGTPHTASISGGRAPSGRAPPRERHHPTEKVLENGTCRVYNAAHFIGANGSLGVLGESRLVASEFLGGKKRAQRGEDTFRPLRGPRGLFLSSLSVSFLARRFVLFCFSWPPLSAVGARRGGITPVNAASPAAAPRSAGPGRLADAEPFPP